MALMTLMIGAKVWPPTALTPSETRIAEAANGDVDLGFVVVDDALDLHLPPGHVEAAPLIDNVDRELRTLHLGLRDSRKYVRSAAAGCRP